MAFTGNARPAVVQRATDYNYVSSLDLSQNVHKEHVDPEFVRRYGNQNMTGFMDMQGAVNAVPHIEYSHFEDDWRHEVVRVTGQAAGAANAAVDLTVAAADHFNPTIASPYDQAGSAEADVITPRINDLLLFDDGTLAMVTAIPVTTADAFEFTAVPVVDGTNIPATTAASEIVIIGNAHEEQTGQPLSRNGRVSRYTNNLMIKKATNTVSGTEAGVQTWIEVGGKGGKKGYLWYFESGYQEYQRFMNECEVTMLLGQQVTNNTLSTAMPKLTITEGLIPFIENYGNNFSYSGMAGYTMADLDNMIKTLDRERGAKENTIWAGINLSLAMDDTFNDLFQAGAVSYGAFSGSQDKAVDLSFSSFSKGGYTFHKKTYDIFNYKKLLGAAGQKYPDFGLVIPSDNNTVGGESVPSMRLNYLQGKGNNYSRAMEEWVTGGANGVFTNDVDEISTHYRAHRGIEAFAPNRFATIGKA